jgi:hypothetical protein
MNRRLRLGRKGNKHFLTSGNASQAKRPRDIEAMARDLRLANRELRRARALGAQSDAWRSKLARRLP